MSQATSINTNVRIFFSDLSDITNFFSNSPQRVSVLDEVVGKEFQMHLLQGGILKLELLTLFMKTEKPLSSVWRKYNQRPDNRIPSQKLVPF